MYHIIKKGIPTLVTQVDLISQNWWKSKISDNLFLNQFIKLHAGHFSVFTVSYFLSEILVIPESRRRRNLENFTFFILKKLVEMPPPICKIWERPFKKFWVSQPGMDRQRGKIWFLESLKCLFWEYILKKINIVRWSSISQWLIFLKKIQPFKLNLQMGENIYLQFWAK